MSRVIKKIEIEGQEVNALFDTGAVNTYILKDMVANVPILSIEQPYKVGLGGDTIEVTEVCVFRGKIEGLGFDGKAIPVEKIGKIDGNNVEAIIGVLVMENWEISVNPKDGTLDLTGLRRREFTEY